MLRSYIASSMIAMLLTSAAVAASRPNIIVIMADDLGYRDLGFTGCTDFETPNIDRLAETGVECLNGYASHPFCAPTRAGLMTGRYQQRFGFETNPAYAPFDERSGLPPTETTIATRLKKVGYRTGLVGKWHLGFSKAHHPLNRGFDFFFGMPGGGHDYFEVDSRAIGEEYKAPLIDNRKYANVEGYLTHQLTDHAIKFIEQSKDDPFFLFLSYNAPHSPFQAPKETIDALAHIPNKKRRAYAAMIVEMDNDIGRVMKTLVLNELEEDTLIFFLSDNGGPHEGVVTDNAPFRDGKGSVREGGIHVPFIACWPGRLPEGTQFEHPVISIDLAPTAAALAGAGQGNMEGVNLIPYLAGEKTGAPHENVFFRRRDGAAWAIISKDGLKLVRPDWQTDTKEHYNLRRDPGELKDLNTPEHQAAVKQLQADWDAWNKSNTRYQFWDYTEHHRQTKMLFESQRK